jgi:hypothetical protein
MPYKDDMTDSQRFEQWEEWLDAIYKDVQNLIVGHHVYEQVRKVIQGNAHLHQPSSFYDMMGMTFSAWAAMAVRRQQDTYSISLSRLLGAVRKYPQVLSRKRFVDRYVAKMLAGFAGNDPEPDDHECLSQAGAYAPSKEQVEHFANEQFNSLVGIGACHVDPEQVGKELEELKAKAEKLADFASKTIAHIVDKPTAIPTLPELDDCIGIYEKTVLRYQMLFRAAASSEMLPTWQYDWMAIFREPWLPKQE